jgi:hypothetical protein
MRKLLFLLVTLTVLWSGYWFAGSSLIRGAAEDWFAGQTGPDLVAVNTGLRVAGYPNRFDMTVDGLKITDATRGLGWQAPFVQVFAMTWKPWHIIAALPPDQVVTLPDQQVAITSDGLRASLRARPAIDLPLAAVIVESGKVSATSTLGWSVGADKAVASVVANAASANAYDIAADVAGFAPDPTLLLQLVPDGSLPPTIAEIRLRATATLTAPLDRNAGRIRPQLMAVDLTDMLVTWGDVTLTASGRIAPDPQGLAAGRIDFTVTNWRRIVPLMVAAGVVKPELARTVETMLASLAQQSGDAEVLKLPLVLTEGWMSMGPLPLGPAPVMLPPSG